MPKAKRVGKENKWGNKSRFYQVGLKQYPSVTTILSVIGKPALVAWSAKVEREAVIEVSANLYQDCPSSPRMSRIGWITSLQSRLTKEKEHTKLLTKAGEVGSQAHSWIEWQIKRELMHDVGPCPVISPAAQLAVSAWERWKCSVSFKPLLCEQAVWSTNLEYAGTMDLLAEINGEVTLLDWKTGKAIYDESFLQNAAYRYAVAEMRLLPGSPKINGMIVRLPKLEKDPEFETKAVPGELADLMEVFMNVRQLWEWLNAKEELTNSPEAEAGENRPTETNQRVVAPSSAAL